MWTISALQLHQAIIVSDEDACDELKVSTYKYFKDIEKDNLDTDRILSLSLNKNFANLFMQQDGIMIWSIIIGGVAGCS